MSKEVKIYEFDNHCRIIKKYDSNEHIHLKHVTSDTRNWYYHEDYIKITKKSAKDLVSTLIKEFGIKKEDLC